MIENYFVHGIDYTRNDNAISVKAYMEQNQTVIKVIDNGKGMSPERLQEVIQSLSDPAVDTATSIGLRNVHERLKSFFGSSYSMEIDSDQMAGTIITIRRFVYEGTFDHV